MIKQYFGSSIRNKLLMITGFGAALIVGAASYGMYTLWSVEQKMLLMVHDTIALETELLGLTSDFKSQIQSWKNVLIRGHDGAQREKYWKKFNHQHKSVQQDVDVLMQTMPDTRLNNQLEEFKQAHAQLSGQYTVGLEKFVSSGFDHKVADMEVRGIDKASAELLQAAAQILNETIKQKLAREEAHAGSALKQTIAMVVMGVVISTFVFLLMVQRIIVVPAKSVARDLALMAEGDFSHEIHVGSSDEIGQVAYSATKLRSDIGGIIEGINQSVFKLSTTSEEMAHNNRSGGDGDEPDDGNGA